MSSLMQSVCSSKTSYFPENSSSSVVPGTSISYLPTYLFMERHEVSLLYPYSTTYSSYPLASLSSNSSEPSAKRIRVEDEKMEDDESDIELTQFRPEESLKKELYLN